MHHLRHYIYIYITYIYIYVYIYIYIYINTYLYIWYKQRNTYQKILLDVQASHITLIEQKTVRTSNTIKDFFHKRILKKQSRMKNAVLFSL